MSLAARIRANYRRELGKFSKVTIRRYYGSASPRAFYERQTVGREISYTPAEIVGSILDGDWMIVLLAEDLETGDVTLPLKSTDKAIVRGKELTIVGIDDKKRRVEDVLCAYELQVRG
jgi:hypothetical protein